MFDADTVGAIAALSKQAHDAAIVEMVDVAGTPLLFRSNPTEHGRQLGDIITPPKDDVLKITTLTGFRDALTATGFDPAVHLIHVEDYLSVALKRRTTDYWGNRATVIKASHTPLDAFKFDQYYNDPQRFIIALQVAFLQTDELLYLIRLASNLKAGDTVHAEDDGFSQAVTVKRGEVSTAEVKVKPRVKLIPLRTFPEADPVESEFLIRFQSQPNQLPSIALFDVDGKKWQGESMQSIKKWLHSELKALKVELPILA